MKLFSLPYSCEYTDFIVRFKFDGVSFQSVLKIFFRYLLSLPLYIRLNINLSSAWIFIQIVLNIQISFMESWYDNTDYEHSIPLHL